MTFINVGLNLFQQNLINKYTNLLNNNVEQVATGKRINKSSADPAGLQLSTRLNAKLSSTKMAIQNVDSGMSLMKTADATLSQVQEMLQHVRELAVQGSNSTYTADQKQLIENEMKMTLDSINDITANTKYNDISLFTGGTGATVSGDSLSDQRVKISGIPVNTAAGAKTTVEFWMKWDGFIGTTKPFGWDTQYDLGFQGTINPAFGFNTGNTNILGIQSAGMENKWVHVAAVFTNGLPDSNNVELYINGEKQTLQEMAPGYPTTSSRTVTDTIYIGGWGNDNNYDFGGSIDDLRIWDGARTQSQIQSEMYSSLSGDENNLLGYWTFDDASLKDETKNGNNGEFINGASLGSGISQGIRVHTDSASGSSDNIGLFNISTQSLNLDNISLSDSELLNKIDKAINSVSTQKTYLGAKMSVYDFKLNDLNNSLTIQEKSVQNIEGANIEQVSSEMAKNQLQLETANKMLSMDLEFSQSKMDSLIKSLLE
ncbi:LamG-like jellyroll fold domain-containing protein [Priestia megaterium]|uniref:flagellin N-terminal helical domain-containing protein n=1 Tax=Priestia megaterium TaxID=1404 RepID=UPI003100E001